MEVPARVVSVGVTTGPATVSSTDRRTNGGIGILPGTVPALGSGSKSKYMLLAEESRLKEDDEEEEEDEVYESEDEDGSDASEKGDESDANGKGHNSDDSSMLAATRSSNEADGTATLTGVGGVSTMASVIVANEASGDSVTPMQPKPVHPDSMTEVVNTKEIITGNVETSVSSIARPVDPTARPSFTVTRVAQQHSHSSRLSRGRSDSKECDSDVEEENADPEHSFDQMEAVVDSSMHSPPQSPRNSPISSRARARSRLQSWVEDSDIKIRGASEDILSHTSSPPTSRSRHHTSSSVLSSGGSWDEISVLK